MLFRTYHLACLAGILTVQILQECYCLTHVFDEKNGFGILLTSKDNLVGEYCPLAVEDRLRRKNCHYDALYSSYVDFVDPRKVMKFMDQMQAFKVQLIRTRQYYQYCGTELKVDLEQFTKWIEYTIEKINTELDFCQAIAHLIQKKSDVLDGL